MKRICYLLLAVLMLLPMMVACGSQREGTPVEVANVKVISYKDAYTEAATGEAGQKDEALAAVNYEGAVTAYLAEGETLTLYHVVEAYVYDQNSDSVYDEANARYTKIDGLAVGEVFFWNYYVNGKESGLGTAVTAEDTIEIIYEK